MWQRFTERARRVVLLGQEEAVSLNSGYVGSEHFLLGLIRENEGIAAHVLQTTSVSLHRVREEVKNERGQQANLPVISEPKLTPQAKRALELAASEARHMKHDYIGTGHLLLGLLREKNTNLAKVLCDSGLNLESARQQIRDYCVVDIEDSTPGEPIEVQNRWEWILLFGSGVLFTIGLVRLFGGEHGNYNIELSFTLFSASIAFICVRNLVAHNAWKAMCLTLYLILLIASICFS